MIELTCFVKCIEMIYCEIVLYKQRELKTELKSMLVSSDFCLENVNHRISISLWAT